MHNVEAALSPSDTNQPWRAGRLTDGQFLSFLTLNTADRLTLPWALLLRRFPGSCTSTRARPPFRFDRGVTNGKY